MSWTRLEKLDTSYHKVRGFGFLFGALCAVAAGYLAFKGKTEWVWCAGAGVFFVASGLFVQAVLRPIYVAWMAFAFVLGWINTRIILGIFFYLILTPIGLLIRIGGKDLLEEKINREAKSYWVRRQQGPVDAKQMERMF